MKYIVLEIQKLADGSVAVPPISSHDTLNAARSAFFTVCAAAAVSDVPLHSAVMLTESGQTLGLESFDHGAVQQDIL